MATNTKTANDRAAELRAEGLIWRVVAERMTEEGCWETPTGLTHWHKGQARLAAMRAGYRPGGQNPTQPVLQIVRDEAPPKPPKMSAGRRDRIEWLYRRVCDDPFLPVQTYYDAWHARYGRNRHTFRRDYREAAERYRHTLGDEDKQQLRRETLAIWEKLIRDTNEAGDYRALNQILVSRWDRLDLGALDHLPEERRREKVITLFREAVAELEAHPYPDPAPDVEEADDAQPDTADAPESALAG